MPRLQLVVMEMCKDLTVRCMEGVKGKIEKLSTKDGVTLRRIEGHVEAEPEAGGKVGVLSAPTLLP